MWLSPLSKESQNVFSFLILLIFWQPARFSSTACFLESWVLQSFVGFQKLKPVNTMLVPIYGEHCLLFEAIWPFSRISLLAGSTYDVFAWVSQSITTFLCNINMMQNTFSILMPKILQGTFWIPSVSQSIHAAILSYPLESFPWLWYDSRRLTSQCLVDLRVLALLHHHLHRAKIATFTHRAKITTFTFKFIDPLIALCSTKTFFTTSHGNHCIWFKS